MIGKEEHKYLTHNLGGKGNFPEWAQEYTIYHWSEIHCRIEAVCNGLHYYSPRAYDFVCRVFALPHASSRRTWAASVDYEPGCLTNNIQHLGKVLKERHWMLDFVLIVDSMKLHSETIWNPKAQMFVGHIDYGTAMPECADGEATETLAFMVVGMTRNWKHPTAYVLQDKCSASVQAQLIKYSIGLVYFEGFQVLAVELDGTYTNQGTAKQLGCVLKVSEFQTWFPQPEKPDTKIYFIFDACYMIKLMRNLLGDYEKSHEINGKCQNIQVAIY